MTMGYSSSSYSSKNSRDPYVAWSRPSDWVAMSDPAIGDTKVQMLVAVFPGDSTYLSFTFQGAVTVDWGDGGATENIATNTTKHKTLNWSSYSSGTLTSKGYRQALITITPQAGQSFTTIDLGVKNTASGLPNGYSSSILDLVIAAPLCTTFTLVPSNGNVVHRMMERFRWVGVNLVTTWATAFIACSGLRTLRCDANRTAGGYDLYTSSGNTFANMFISCSSLEEGPIFSGSASVTTTASMFSGCGKLRSVPLFNTASVTAANSMFASCTSLTTVPAFDMTSCTNMTSIFSGCSALASVPIVTTPVLSNLTTAFASCTSLTAAPAWNWSAVTSLNQTFTGCTALYDTSGITGTTNLLTDMSNTFLNCKSLVTVASFATHGVTTVTSCFSGCSALQTFPTPSGNNWKLTACTVFTGMFTNCSALVVCPLLDTSAGTNFNNMFNGCQALTTVAGLNVAAGTTFTTMFSSCTSLQSAPLAGGRFTISYASCMLNAAALDAIYTALGTASGSQTITVTSNPGTTGDTPTIATGKGWTVTGS